MKETLYNNEQYVFFQVLIHNVGSQPNLFTKRCQNYKNWFNLIEVFHFECMEHDTDGNWFNFIEVFQLESVGHVKIKDSINLKILKTSKWFGV